MIEIDVVIWFACMWSSSISRLQKGRAEYVQNRNIEPARNIEDFSVNERNTEMEKKNQTRPRFDLWLLVFFLLIHTICAKISPTLNPCGFFNEQNKSVRFDPQILQWWRVVAGDYDWLTGNVHPLDVAVRRTGVDCCWVRSGTGTTHVLTGTTHVLTCVGLTQSWAKTKGRSYM